MINADGHNVIRVRTLKLNNNKAEIFFNDDLEEYMVKWFFAGKHIPNADYFTDDKNDAYETARIQLDTLKP